MLDRAVADEKLSASARENILRWLTESRYARYRDSVVHHIETEKWRQLDDAFWTIIPFGTGGRRGCMYPIGSNTINERTIGESASGLAAYVRSVNSTGADLSCAIAYDTRHNSRTFAELCARIMVAADFSVYFLDDFRSTPELSFLVRHKNCSCGIMVTASHNPPSDNAVKVYWSTGGQILPPHDEAIIELVMNVGEIEEGISFEEAVAQGAIEICTTEIDGAFVQAVASEGFGGDRNLSILYSPLHGVGASAVCPVLAAAGFSDVEVFADHASPSGDFPNVPGHVSNPENPEVYEAIVARAQESGADLVMVSDPDCDRIGCSARVSLNADAAWRTFNGNQIGVLLADYVLERRKSALTSQHYLVKTLVTTEMIRRIGESYGVATHGDLLVGFKWIGAKIDEAGPEHFVFGAEESHGYLMGQYARDKDGAMAAMLLAELAAKVKSEGKTLHEKLDDLYWQHGYHAERLMTIRMEGSQGMIRMQQLMKELRENPPQAISGIAVSGLRDYLAGRTILPDGSSRSLQGPTGDIVVIDLADDGNYVAVRPSGTEPKVKVYLFTYVAPELLSDLETAKQEMDARLDGIEKDLRAIAEADSS